jgi:TolB-like protein/predicted Ser/Thr protein kinase
MIGKTISRYRITEKLGEGGMGVVYKAEDSTLRRTVALKLLPPEMARDAEARTRFLHEAQAAAALNHPNICTIYEIGEDDGQTFIAMALVEGESLKHRIEAGPLPVGEAVDIAAQVAEGLAAAHKRGIVHSDMKPDNVMITPEDRARIMDFGLAQCHWQTSLTKTDTTTGTVAYMSPEQSRGDDVDHRTDIWSLGVTLYEAVTGRRPFRGDYEQAVVYSILNEKPASISDLRPGVPEALERIVNKATAKDPEERYQAASDLLDDLTTLARELEDGSPKEKSAEPTSQPSIAVLPFTNMSADPEQEYFCDGMAEEITNALTRVDGLRVVARTSAFVFKGKHEDVREVGNKLDVGTVLEGSVRKAGNKLRITAQLVNVADGYHIWSERYDREMEDVFGIQDEIAVAIVESLKVKLMGGERTKLLKHNTDDVEAHELYLKGRFLLSKYSEDGVRRAVEYFDKAIEEDADYALPLAGLAESYHILAASRWMPQDQAWEKARRFATRALELDENLAEAHLIVADMKLMQDWDWEGAEKGFRQAIELNPGHAATHCWFAWYLTAMGRHEEALEEAVRAEELDPLSPFIRMGVAGVLLDLGKYEEAAKRAEEIIASDPGFDMAYRLKGLCLIMLSEFDEAMETFRKARFLAGREEHAYWPGLGLAYALSGRTEEAEKEFEELIKDYEIRRVPPHHMAQICVALGRVDEAFEWLDRAYEAHSPNLVRLKVDHWYDSIRSDPRFDELLAKMRLDK